MFKALLLTSALVVAVPVHATSAFTPNQTSTADDLGQSERKACWLSTDCFKSTEDKSSHLEPDDVPNTLKLFTVKIARR